MNEAFLRSTILVSYQSSPDRAPSGTGFFVFRAIAGNKGHVLLVTNKHLLPPEGAKKSVNLRLSVKQGEVVSVQSVDMPIVGDDGKYMSSVRVHPHPSCDTAAVNVTEAIIQKGVQGEWVPMDLLVTPDVLRSEDITVGDEVFLLGFPDAIFDPRNASPLLRTGVIATVPTEGYAFNARLQKLYDLPDHIDGFLIDANVFPGSSGSIVILKPQPTTIGLQGQTIVSAAKKRPYVLGIVSGSIPIRDSALGSIQRMGLGIVHSAAAIRQTIELHYR